jgi:hypothetical protein
MEDVGGGGKERGRRGRKEKKGKKTVIKEENRIPLGAVRSTERAIGTQKIQSTCKVGGGCRRIPGVVSRWEETGCFCGYDEACTRSFREESQREKGALNARPTKCRRRESGMDAGEAQSVCLARKEMIEGRFRRQREQNEVRFDLREGADWRRGGPQAAREN